MISRAISFIENNLTTESQSTQRNTEKKMITQRHINELSFSIIGCAIEVHKYLGPGLLESVYEPCFIDELKNKKLIVQSQLWVPIHYKGKALGGTLKLDLLINDLIVVEIKAVDTMIPLFDAQLLSYLKLANKPKGLLINFHSLNISSSVVSLVTERFSDLPKE